MTDLAIQLSDLFPERFRVIYIGIVLLGALSWFIWDTYRSDRAILENKLRELEIIKLALETDSLTGDDNKSRLVGLNRQCIDDLVQFYEARRQKTDLSGRLLGVVGTLKQRLKNRKTRRAYSSFGALGGLYLTLFVFLYTVNLEIISKPGVLEFLIWLYGFLAVFNLSTGGFGGILAGKSKLSASIGGFLTASLFAPTGVALFITLLKWRVIPLDVVIK